MLDKSIPYMDVLMCRKKCSPILDYSLPKEFKFSHFKSGDEKSWAKIETSVLEFNDELDALIYFQKEYLPFFSELERRCIFIENDKGDKIATATAWFAYSGIRRDPWLHWVAVHPRYQGLGLGKALISNILQLMKDIEGDRDFYLHTQTWSHVAIRLYLQMGFLITDEKNLSKYANDKYPQNIELLRSIGIGV